MSDKPDSPPSTNKTQTAQRDALLDLGIDVDRIYVDHGLTGAFVRGCREEPATRSLVAGAADGPSGLPVGTI